MRPAPHTVRLAQVRRVCLCPGWPLAMLLALSGCARYGDDVLEGVPASALVVLESATGETGAWSDLLQDLFPRAAYYAAADRDEAISQAVRRRAILVVADAHRLPQQDWPAVEAYIKDGGAALFLGRAPFEARALLGEDGAHLLADQEQALAATAFGVAGFTSIQTWRHRNSSGRIRGAVRVTPIPGVVWSGVEVEAESFRDWDAMVLDRVPGALHDSGANTLVFHARGDARTGRLALVAREADGSYWSHVIAVGRGWRRFVVHEEDFVYAFGGSGRGGANDSLSLGRMDRITAGLSMHLAPQPPGGQSYSFSDFYLARDARSPAERRAWPDLPLLAPPAARYTFPAASVQIENASRAWPTGQSLMESPFPRGRAAGAVAEDGPLRRWAPLARAYDSRGELIGWPAGIYIEAGEDQRLQRWGWIGAEPETSARVACREMLMAALRRLYAGTFLLAAGADRFGFEMDESMDVTAVWTEGERMRVPLRVAVELISRDGRTLRRVVSSAAQTTAGALQGPVTLRMGRAPGLRERAEPYTFRVLLEDASGSGDLYDEILQKVVVRPVGGAEPAWTTVEAAHFVRQQTPLFLMGVNYRPLYTTGASADAWGSHWLDASVFDPDAIERDLNQLRALRVNALAFDYTHPLQAPQLKYVIEAARERDMVLLLHLPGLAPFERNFGLARTLVEAADLQNESQVFAFDLANEPRLGRFEERRALDRYWRHWLSEQYGSVQHAEEHFGAPLWRLHGRVTGPPDQALASDGDHRIAVAAYRRFVDDLVSRRYGESARFLRELGCRQLLTARTGYRGTGSAWADAELPVDPAAGAVHLDFLSLTAWHLQGDPEEFGGAAFLAAYARGVGDGKPVVWLQYGADVGPTPSEVELANQERVYRNTFDLVAATASAGCFAWWYPGGTHPEEGSDFGMVHPTGLPRPAAEALRSRSTALRTVRPRPVTWTGREVLRERDARGLSALWRHWEAHYRREIGEGEMIEVRPTSYGRPTTEIPLVAIGGEALSGREPVRDLNAEWGTIRVGDAILSRPAGASLRVAARRRVVLQLLNTGAATWTPSREGQARTVWIVARHESNFTDRIRVGSVAYGRSLSVEWQPTLEGEWRIRPWLSRVGPFGEELFVQVSPESTP